MCHVRSLGIACFSLVVGVSRCYSVENWRCVWNSVDIIIVIKLALARIFLSNCQEYFLISGVFSNWRFRSSFTSNHNCLVKLFDRHFCSIKMRVNDSKQFYSLRESIIHCFFTLLNIRTLSRNSDVCIDQNVNMESSELLNILTGQRTRVFLSTVSALAFPSGRKNIKKSHQIFLSWGKPSFSQLFFSMLWLSNLSLEGMFGLSLANKKSPSFVLLYPCHASERWLSFILLINIANTWSERKKLLQQQFIKLWDFIVSE